MATSGRFSPNKVRKRLLDDTWVFPNSGMVLMRPTSIVLTGTSASATIGANGSVSFSAVDSLSLNGVFTSVYDNYMVVCRATVAASANVLVRLRASGADDATTNSYVYQGLFANSTAVSGARTTTNTANVFNAYNTQRVGSTINFYGPCLTQPTAYRSVNVGDQTSADIADYAGTHNQSVSYDGFTLYVGATNLTGLISVYGLGG